MPIPRQSQRRLCSRKRPGPTSRSTTAATRATATFGLGKGGAVEQQIDFRYERAEKTGLEIKPGDKLFLAVKAADKFDLARRAARRHAATAISSTW